MDIRKYFRSNNDEESLDSIICRYKNMSLDEKRQSYKCGESFVVLDDIPFWPVLYKLNGPNIKQAIERKMQEDNRKPVVEHKYYLKDESLPTEPFSVNNTINMKISLWQGDITKFEIDAIVNAANERCRGGGGVDGAIHKAAGYTFTKECITLNGCRTGEAKITTGHKLPAKYVIHTVGPIGKDPELLKSCYENCLRLVRQHGIKSIAFSCISTGVYGYPKRDAAHMALKITRMWMEQHSDKIDRIIFCTFLSADFEVYQQLMAQYYFPCESLQKPMAESKDINNEQKVPLETDEADAYNRKVPSESDDNCTEEHPSADSGDLTASSTKTNIDDSAMAKFGVETADTKTDIGDLAKKEGEVETDHTKTNTDVSAQKEGGVEMDHTKTDIDITAKKEGRIEMDYTKTDINITAKKEDGVEMGHTKTDIKDSAEEKVGVETVDFCNNATKDILGSRDASECLLGKDIEISEGNSQEIMDFGSQEDIIDMTENSSQQMMDLGSQQPEY